MANCRNCGFDIKDGARFCPYCGQSLRNTDAYQRAGADHNNPAGNYGTNNGSDSFRGNGSANYQASSSANYQASSSGSYRGNGSAGYRDNSRNYRYYREDGFDVRDVNDNRNLAVLCYFNVLLVIPLLLRPSSAYIRYHCNQGLLLTVFSLLVSALSRLPFIGWIAGALGTVFVLICFVLGVLNAVSGSVRHLPVIGVFRIIT